MNGKYVFKNFLTEADLMNFLNEEKILPAHVVSIMFNDANFRFYLIYFQQDVDS